MFWDMGYNSFESFFKSFNVINTKTLKLTRQVLTEHQQLEVAVVGFQEQVNIGLSKLKQMQEEERILLKHMADIEANKEFNYAIEEEHADKIPITNEFVTNCLKCNLCIEDLTNCLLKRIILFTCYLLITHMIFVH